MAEFCVATGYTPQQYRDLTLAERNAMIDVVNRVNERR